MRTNPNDADATAEGGIGLSAFIEQTCSFELETWQQLICARLERLKDETGQRILIHGPPQFGKSIIISQRFPCWLLGMNPLLRIRLACYNLTHAERFAKVNLSIMRSDEYAAVFPDPQARVPKVCPAEEWSTVARADMLDANPSFKALGLGTGFTGLGVDTLIIDDPYKNSEEARSETINENIWLWHNDVVLPRLNPKTNVVVMFHRWQDNDYAGRLLAQGGWEYLRFAAIKDNDPDPEGLQRTPDGLLTNRYPLAYLEDVQRKQGRSFYALYQGKPRPPEGDYFKRAWFSQFVGVLPNGCTFARYWDKAGADEGKGDYTVGVLMARDKDGYYYVADVVRGQWPANERNKIILQTAELDNHQYGYVDTYIEQPPGLAKESTEAVVRLLAGYPVKADPVNKDKIERAEPFKDQCQAGNVRLLKASWNSTWINELCDFPTGKHDDQVDATSGAFNKLALGSLGVWGSNPMGSYRG